MSTHLLNTPSLWIDHFEWPSAQDHKYTRGHVLVWGGVRLVGAARLAAQAAARVGAGLVSLMVPEHVWPVYAAHLVSGMAQPLADDSPESLLRSWQEALARSRWQALVLGPGAMPGLPGDAQAHLRELVCVALAAPGGQPLVLDADALTVFERVPQMLFDMLASSTHPVVLTPHAGEFDRLFGHAQTSEEDKAARTLSAAQRSGAVVVHKGSQTVVAAPDGRVVVQAQAPAWLATAGAGDVLAGFVAGLLAQGVPLFEAACMAVWLHADCARALGPGLLAEDLPAQVSSCMRAIKPCADADEAQR